jgi:hypothetical protein
MTTSQTIIVIIIGLLMIIGYFKVAFNISSEKQNSGLFGLCLLTVMAFVCLTLFAIQTSEYNELREKLKNKCPEYEKIDTYKLKINGTN